MTARLTQAITMNHVARFDNVASDRVPPAPGTPADPTDRVDLSTRRDRTPSRWFDTIARPDRQKEDLKVRPSASYLICCCERTGSTLLGEALAGTGIAGRPFGYFSRVAPYNPRTRQILTEAKDHDSYLDKVIVAATTPNGVFGAKVHWEHFLDLIAKAERLAPAQDGKGTARVLEILRPALPDLRYVWLVRRNDVARAISHYRAKKTNRWHVDSRWLTDDADDEGEPDFDFNQIDAFVRSGRRDDARWRQFFQENDIAPFEVIYEEMIDDLAETVRRVLGFIGIPFEHVALPRPTLRKLADGRSQEWEARYRRICADANA
jgi:LPS sulfotransferase NodH